MIRRVRERETFAAFARGDRRRHGQITVTRVRLETSGPPQVAFRVGKRVGNAVTRNRVRRRLRAALQDHARAGLLDPGCAYLVGAAPPAAGAPYAELARSLGAALTDLGQAPR